MKPYIYSEAHKPRICGRISQTRTPAILSAILIPGVMSHATQFFFVQEMLVAVILVAVPFVALMLFLVALALIQEAGRCGIQFVKESAKVFDEHHKQLKARYSWIGRFAHH